MKKILLGLLAAAGILSTGNAYAQVPAAVPNGTLDTWVPRNAGEAPQNWVTTDDVLSILLGGVALPFSSGTVTKSTDVHGGAFSARMQNVVTLFTPEPIPGIIALGTPASLLATGGGVPYTSRPARMQFWYKLTGAAAVADSAFYGVALGKNGSLVASQQGYLTPATTYTLVDAQLQYSQSVTPDSLIIQFTSGSAENISAGTTLTVDDVVLTGTVTGSRDKATEAALQIYPNPSATGEFSLASLGNAAIATAPYSVLDATGRVVLRQAAAPASASHGRLVDLRGQQAGVYLLRLDTPAGPLTRKLVIQ